MTLPDLIGLLGVAASITAYALLHLDKLGSNDTGYLPLNGLGSCLILVSLVDSFNLPSFVTRALRLVFTVVGFVRPRGTRVQLPEARDPPGNG